MSKQRLIYSTFILFGVLLGMGLGIGIGGTTAQEKQKPPAIDTTVTTGLRVVNTSATRG